jgi:hypothetical protein
MVRVFVLKALMSGHVHCTVVPVVGQVPPVEGVAETKVTVGSRVTVMTGLVAFELEALWRFRL